MTQRIPVTPELDILLVIDNSASTSDKQTVFAASFPKLVAALDAFPAGRPSLHIGVVDTTVDIGTNMDSSGVGAGCPSPDPADNGKLQDTARVPDCTPQNGAFIVDVPSGAGSARTTNYSGTLDVALACIAQVGASGCGFSAPLEAMKRALDGSNPSNAGFVRPDALLAVVVVTDEDDFSAAGSAVFALPDGPKNPAALYQCDQPVSPTTGGTYSGCVPRLGSGMTDPASYAAFLDDVKGVGQVVAGVIAGPPPGLMTDDMPPLTDSASATDITVAPMPIGSTTDPLAIQPSCQATIDGEPVIARPAIRLASFLEHFGADGRFYSACQGDYSAPLADFARTVYDATSACLVAAVARTDIDPANPGTQLDCSVVDAVGLRIPTQSEAVIPACAMSDATHPAPGGARPCWWVATDPTACPAPDSGLELQVERTTPPPAGDVVVVQCVAGA